MRLVNQSMNNPFHAWAVTSKSINPPTKRKLQASDIAPAAGHPIDRIGFDRVAGGLPRDEPPYQWRIPEMHRHYVGARQHLLDLRSVEIPQDDGSTAAKAKR